MKKMINLKINNIPVTVPEGTTVLQAAKSVNIEIPSLCYLKETRSDCRLYLPRRRGPGGSHKYCYGPCVQKDHHRADPLHAPQEMSFLRERKPL